MKCTAVFRVLFVSMAATVCVQQVGTLLYNFFTSDKWTINTMYKSEREMVLPEISLCNYNQINASLAAEIGINDRDLQELIKGTRLEAQWSRYAKDFDGIVSLSDFMFQAIIGGIKFTVQGVIPLNAIAELFGISPIELHEFESDLYEMYFNKTRISYARLYRSLSHSCEQSAISCSTGPASWSGCCSGSKQVVTERGLCTKLHPTYRMQSYAGSGSGYLILFQLHTDNFISSIVDMDLESGISLHLGYGDNITTQVSVRPNTKASIKLNRIQDTATRAGGWDGSFFPAPCRSQVSKGSKVFDNMKSCQQNCIGRLSFQFCRCTVNPSSAESRACEAHESLRCTMKRVLHEYYYFHNMTYLRSYVSIPWDTMNQTYVTLFKCWDSCTKSCEQTRITTTVTTTEFATLERIPKLRRYVSRAMGHDLSDQYIRRNFIYLDIYFEHFAIQQNVLFPKATFNELMGLIGGQLGLWIGASMVTIIDLIPHIGKVIVRLFSRKQHSSSKRKKAFIKF